MTELLFLGTLYIFPVAAAPATVPATSPTPRSTLVPYYHCDDARLQAMCENQYNSSCVNSLTIRTDYQALCGPRYCRCDWIGPCGRNCKVEGEEAKEGEEGAAASAETGEVKDGE